MVMIDVYADSTRWKIGQTYTITVLTTLRDINGNYLSTPYSCSFTPEPCFRKISTDPRNGRTGVEPVTSIIVEFNNRVKFETLESSVSFSPSIQESWSAGNYSIVFFQPSSQLHPLTMYTVTLDTGIHDVQYHSLPSPCTFSFTTGS